MQQKKEIKIFQTVGILLIFIILISYNSEAQKTKAEKPINTRLPNLYLSETEFDNLNPTGDKQRIIFQFYFLIDRPNKLITLAAWPSKDYNYETPQFLHPGDPSKIDISEQKNGFFLGDQKLSNRQYEDIKKELDRGAYDYVVFEPQYNSKNNHIYYDIYVSKDTKIHELTSKKITNTDPSPPATAKQD